MAYIIFTLISKAIWKLGIQTDFKTPLTSIYISSKRLPISLLFWSFKQSWIGCSLLKVQFDQKVFTWKECGRIHCFLVLGIFSPNPWKLSVQIPFHITQIRENTYIILTIAISFPGNLSSLQLWDGNSKGPRAIPKTVLCGIPPSGSPPDIFN